MKYALMKSGLQGKEREKFKKWLMEYETDLDNSAFFESLLDDLRAEDDEDDKDYRDPALMEFLEKASKDIPVEPGQIRILKGEMLSYPVDTTCILVLTQWAGNRWLIAPFSPYSKPATEGELDTGIDYFRYRVVESWNAVVVPDALLRSQSEYLQDAGESVRKDACTVFFQKLEGTEIPEELKDRVGPPIQNDLDPRIQYLLNEKYQLKPLREKAQEIEDFNERLAASIVWSGDPGDTGNDSEPPVATGTAAAVGFGLFGNLVAAFLPTGSASRLELAAAHKKKTVRLEFHPDDIPCLLTITWECGKGTIHVNAFRKDNGALDRKSFDGIQLRRTSDGQLIGEIRDGTLDAEFRADFSRDGIYFSSPDNTPLKGTWKE